MESEFSIDLQAETEKATVSLHYGPEVANGAPLDIGATLAAADDYCLLPSGYLGSTHVFLPEIDAQDADAILDRLKRMLHAPQNPQVIEKLLEAASRRRKQKRAAGNGAKEVRTPLINRLKDLALDLHRAHSAQPRFASFLLQGRVADALGQVPTSAEGLNEATILDLACRMTVVWGLHDLQIIAARLYQLTWTPGGELAPDLGPRASTVATVEKIVRNDFEALELIQRILAGNATRGERQSFQNYIKKRPKLLRNAISRGKEQYGLTEEQLMSKLYVNEKIEKVQREAIDRGLPEAGRTVGKFEAVAAETVVTEASAARAQQAGEEAEPTSLSHADISQLLNGMTANVAMAYAVRLFVMRMEKIEETVAAARSAAVASQAHAAVLPTASLTNGQVSSIDALFAVYRAAIFRDPQHLVASSKNAEDSERKLLDTAVGTFGSPDDALLPPSGKPLTRNDVLRGVGVSLYDKLGDGYLFTHEETPGSKARFARPGQEATTSARALISEAIRKKHRPNEHFDLSLPARLTISTASSGNQFGSGLQSPRIEAV